MLKYSEKYHLWANDETGETFYKKNPTSKDLRLSHTFDSHGYKRVSSKNKLVQQHRVIWETFVGEIPEGYEIDHINHRRDDNRLCNLRVVTRSENQRHKRPFKWGHGMSVKGRENWYNGRWGNRKSTT